MYNLNALKFPHGLKNLIHPNPEVPGSVTDDRDLVGVF